MQSTRRSTLKTYVAAGAFQQPNLAKLLWPAFDTAAFREQCSEARAATDAMRL